MKEGLNMAHVMKMSKGACGHMIKHYERAKDEQGEYVKFGNQEINLSLTHLNYNLAPERSQGNFIRQRCTEVKCLNRKDVNVACDWVVTVPKSLPEHQHEAFFKSVYKFLEDKYGKENVVSAFVHKDESQPHIHFCFVPVVTDKKKGIQKVSAYELLNKRELQRFHGDLQNHVEKQLGCKVDVLNGATMDGNRSISELKRETDQLNLKIQNMPDMGFKTLLFDKDNIKVSKEDYNALNEQYKVVKRGFANLFAEHSLLAQKMSELNTQKADLEELKNHYQVLYSSQTNLNKVLENTQQSLKIAEIDVDIYKNYFLNAQDKVEGLKTKLSQATQEIEKLSSQLDKSKTYVARVKTLESELDTVKKNFSVSVEKRVSKHIQPYIMQVAELKDQMQDFEDLKMQHERDQKIINSFKPAMLSIQKIKNLQKEVNWNSEYFSENGAKNASIQYEQGRLIEALGVKEVKQPITRNRARTL